MSVPRENVLLTAALEARKNSHCPISGYKVGAALMSSSGRVYAGTNVEDPAFNHTIHAEQAAIGTMVAAEGVSRIAEIVVVGGTNATPPISSCGHCRQLLVEMTDDDTPIRSYSEDGTYRGSWTLGELLPHASRLRNFK